jgi:ethanolamine-phosphate cytidylyltransferase
MSADEEALPPGTPAAEILEDRIWVDGCWDFFHHGHAGAMLQARQLGTELYVGVHSDEAILENKGPTVMTLKERYGQVPPYHLPGVAKSALLIPAPGFLPSTPVAG